MDLQKCDNCKKRNQLCLLCRENNKYEPSDFSHDKEIYDKAYAEGKSRQLFAEIKIDAGMMKEMIDEKIKEFAVDIQATRNAAIDEFSERLKNHLNQFDFWKYGISDGRNYEARNYDHMIDEIAEQMKGGVE